MPSKAIIVGNAGHVFGDHGIQHSNATSQTDLAPFSAEFYRRKSMAIRHGQLLTFGNSYISRSFNDFAGIWL